MNNEKNDIFPILTYIEEHFKFIQQTSSSTTCFGKLRSKNFTHTTGLFQ